MTQLYLDGVDAHTRDIQALSQRIEVLMEPFLSARDLLENIAGVSQILAEVFIAETGGNMAQFPTPGPVGVLGGCQPRIERVRRPGQVLQDQTREPLPQGRSRFRGAVRRTLEGHLILGEVPPTGRDPRTCESARRGGTCHARHRLDFAHQPGVLPRPGN